MYLVTALPSCNSVAVATLRRRVRSGRKDRQRCKQEEGMPFIVAIQHRRHDIGTPTGGRIAGNQGNLRGPWGITIRLSAIAALSLTGRRHLPRSAPRRSRGARSPSSAGCATASTRRSCLPRPSLQAFGIDHKIVDGGPGKNPIPIVAVGQAQFGLATNGMALIDRAARQGSGRRGHRGRHAAPAGARPPTCLLSFARRSAALLKDMGRKTVGTQAGNGIPLPRWCQDERGLRRVRRSSWSPRRPPSSR